MTHITHNTAWYNQQTDKLTAVSKEIHKERMAMQPFYRRKYLGIINTLIKLETCLRKIVAGSPFEYFHKIIQ